MTYPICVCCKTPVKFDEAQYEVFEKMHWTCFHFVFEHDMYDVDEPCDDPGCLWNRVNDHYVESYNAMMMFLENYANRQNTNDISVLLRDLQLLQDGSSKDPTLVADWRDCINHVRIEKLRRNAGKRNRGIDPLTPL
ncbi:hypothetical protein FZW96_07885 [Bacillus sp. BGMRC 2118]|nr:hypothetical protein FZW96_07885 [Bacillus sp. BGMRC 2118]